MYNMPKVKYSVYFWRRLCSFIDSTRFVQASRARLFKEYKEVQREKVADPDIQLVCDDSNIFKWTALIKVSSVETSKTWSTI